MKKILNNRLLTTLIILLFISFILGILFIAILSKTDKQLIKDNLSLYFSNLNKLNYTKGIINSITSNYLYLLIILILSFSIIGIPIIICILLLKGFLLGLSISSIIYYYKFKGILIAIIYVIPLIINLFLIFILSYYGIKVSNYLIKTLFYKKSTNIKYITKKYIKLFLMASIIEMISCTIEIFLIPNLFKLLQI